MPKGPITWTENDAMAEIERLTDELISVENVAKDRYCKMQSEIERLTIINKALMNALDAAIDYTIMRDRETYAALEDAITAATEAYDARQI